MARRATEKEKVIRGTDNVFADLGLPDADELFAKAQLAHAITSTVRERGLTQTALSKLSGISQPMISRLLGGSISGFSSDRLMHILTHLDQDVIIMVRPKPLKEKRPAQISVDALP